MLSHVVWIQQLHMCRNCDVCGIFQMKRWESQGWDFIIDICLGYPNTRELIMTTWRFILLHGLCLLTALQKANYWNIDDEFHMCGT